jgi:rubrerythrin
MMASIKRKNEMAGVGCAIQGIGLALLLWWPIGTILGLVLLVYGSMRACYYVCGHCGNRIADKGVKMCPVCKSVLEP